MKKTFQRHFTALLSGLMLASAGAQTASNLPPARVITREGGVDYLRRDAPAADAVARVTKWKGP